LSRKFAQVTADLLTRTGEAPSALSAEETSPQHEPHAPREPDWDAAIKEDFVPDGAAKKSGDPASRKVFLRLSASEDQRLKIAALKKGTTRNALIRAALISYLDELTREFGGECGCIAAENARSNTCTWQREKN
jgi:hypothetical protein